MQFVIELFNNYGYIVLFIALILELIALPLPGKFLGTNFEIYHRLYILA